MFLKGFTLLLFLCVVVLSSGNLDLFQAASEGDNGKVVSLLHTSVDINYQQSESGWTSLMAAVGNSHFDVVHTLLNAGANTNFQEKDGWTALSFASAVGDEDLVRMLLENGANPLLLNNNRMLPATIAKLEEHRDVHFVLLQSSIISVLNDEDVSEAFLMFLLEDAAESFGKDLVNIPNQNDWTVMHWLAKRGATSEISRAIELGANVNWVEKDGWTPLMFSAFLGFHDTVELLLSNGATANNVAVDLARNAGHDDVGDLIHSRIM